MALVEDLAARFADEQAAVASRPLQVTSRVGVARVVLGTDGVVGAKMSHLQSHLDVVMPHRLVPNALFFENNTQNYPHDLQKSRKEM